MRLARLALFACLSLTVVNGQQATAIVDVTVVPMDRERLAEHQTVIVQNGRIAAVGPKQSVRLTASVIQIDGRGKFLMPGLTDMHVHFVREALPENLPANLRPGRPPGIPASASMDHAIENQAYSLMFLVNGVTSVRNMWGGSEVVDALAKEIESGAATGPHIYSTGNITDGNPPRWAGARMVQTADQAEEAVRYDKHRGYVATKVYSLLSKDAYEAIVAAARREGMPVSGHVPFSVGLKGAIAARQDSIEHLDDFLRAMAPPVPATAGQAPSAAELFKQADLTKLPPLVQSIKVSGIWTCPTVALNNAPKADPGWAEAATFVPPQVYERYARMYPTRAAAVVNPRTTPEAHAVYVAIVATLHKGGAQLLLGTDTMKIATLPGYSLHDELEYFVEAGMTPYEAIRAGTSDAARFLHRENEFGRVTQGLRADLLLTDANPLADVRNASKISGVMVAGHWFTKADLKQRLLDLRASYRH